MHSPPSPGGVRVGVGVGTKQNHNGPDWIQGQSPGQRLGLLGSHASPHSNVGVGVGVATKQIHIGPDWVQGHSIGQAPGSVGSHASPHSAAKAAGTVQIENKYTGIKIKKSKSFLIILWP